MRKVGLLKWFGPKSAYQGTSPDYGFIEIAPGDDLYVNRENFRTHPLRVPENTPVAFEIGPGRRRGQWKAVDAGFLQDETDPGVLLEGVAHPDERVRQVAVITYLKH